jgi:hypothetical protein
MKENITGMESNVEQLLNKVRKFAILFFGASLLAEECSMC